MYHHLGFYNIGLTDLVTHSVVPLLLVTLKLVVTIVKYLLGSLLLLGFHIVILYSIKHLNKSAYCIFMSMNQMMMYIIQLLQAFWLLQFVSP
jgi:hypothetical protein